VLRLVPDNKENQKHQDNGRNQRDFILSKPSPGILPIADSLSGRQFACVLIDSDDSELFVRYIQYIFCCHPIRHNYCQYPRYWKDIHYKSCKKA
jgi:hypothetical protein